MAWRKGRRGRPRKTDAKRRKTTLAERRPIVDLGSPVGHAKKVAGGATTKSEIKAGGFSILQADSIEKVSALLLKHPHHHSPGASIEILEFIPIPGM